MNLFAELGALRQLPPSNLAVQKKMGPHYEIYY